MFWRYFSSFEKYPWLGKQTGISLYNYAMHYLITYNF